MRRSNPVSVHILDNTISMPKIIFNQNRRVEPCPCYVTADPRFASPEPDQISDPSEHQAEAVEAKQ